MANGVHSRRTFLKGVCAGTAALGGCAPTRACLMTGRGNYRTRVVDTYLGRAIMDPGEVRLSGGKGRSRPRTFDRDKTARIFAMITGVDRAMGRLFRRLKEFGLYENTLVLFLVDNGSNSARYVGGVRGRKSQVYEGGIRSPFFAQWPAVLPAGGVSKEVAAHIDVLPTVLEACRVSPPGGLRLDGRSLLPLLMGKEVPWKDRMIVIQSHRGDTPVLHHNFAARTRRWKLLHASGFGKARFQGPPRFELYDMERDPFETGNLAGERPEVVDRMKKAYEAWSEDVGSIRPDNYAPPGIYIGTPFENPVVLTRQDQRHFKGRPWGRFSDGRWLLHAASAGAYTVRLRFPAAAPAGGRAVLRMGGKTLEKTFPRGARSVLFEGVRLEKGDLSLEGGIPSGRVESGPWKADVWKGKP